MISKLKLLFGGRQNSTGPPLIFPKIMGLPDWKSFLSRQSGSWQKAIGKSRSPRVLLATNVGGHGPVSTMESMLAVALTLRGADVHTLLCDGILPACLRAEHADIPDPKVLVDYKVPQVLCPGCRARGSSVFEPLGLSHYRLSELLSPSHMEEARQVANDIPLTDIREFQYRMVGVGEQAYAGSLRYFARGDLGSEPFGELVLRRYLEASILSAQAIERLFSLNRYDVACFHHGLYVPQGVVGQVCRRRSVRVVNWFVAYRRNSFIFSHDDTYHHTLMSEPTDVWEICRVVNNRKPRLWTI